jgi:hypothetical protein
MAGLKTPQAITLVVVVLLDSCIALSLFSHGAAYRF